MMNDLGWQKAYLRLHSKAALKQLELPYIYRITTDELYEIDGKAVNFFLQCDGTQKGEELTSDNEFVCYCLEEGILEALASPDPVNVSINEKVEPSLRYLELQLTHQCNLRCGHCYLGTSKPIEMPLSEAVKITKEFSDMGGLRLLISGGEPLLYKGLRTYLDLIKELPVRRILFSNGTLIDSHNVSWLDVDEIQFSLDGWIKGHEAIRGAGTFEKTMTGIRAAAKAGRAISIATMIHKRNTDEFERMKEFIQEIGAVEWGIDVMCVAGALENNKELALPYKDAVSFLDYAFGGGYHGSSEGYACGRHLMTVMPDGRAAKCGFYRDNPLGDARKGLKKCWLKSKHTPLSQLECNDCSVLNECRGGCRFRAPGPLAPDPAMCCYYGISR